MNKTWDAINTMSPTHLSNSTRVSQKLSKIELLLVFKFMLQIT